jgi:hypothetical protein
VRRFGSPSESQVERERLWSISLGRGSDFCGHGTEGVERGEVEVSKVGG